MDCQRTKNLIAGKRLWEAILSTTLTSSAKDVYQLLELLISGELREKFPMNVPLPKWHSFYKSHRRLQNTLADNAIEPQFNDVPNSEVYAAMGSVK